MTGRVKFPVFLYIRVDRPLRAALVGAAEAEGVTVSDLARRELRKVFASGAHPGSSIEHTSAGRR